jgi:hypothetical protein
MADENPTATARDNPDAELAAKLPPQERGQPDPAMSLARVGPAGLTFFALVAIAILTVVLIGLNGANETAPSGAGKAPTASSASNTSPPPTPTAPANGPGAKP